MRLFGGQGKSGGERLVLRDVSGVLLFKLAAMSLLWYLFFGPAHTVVVTPAKVDRALFDPVPARPQTPTRS